MILYPRFLIKYFLTLIAFVALFSEFLIYRLQQFSWINLKCNATDTNCTKIMFVADPQILGEAYISAKFGYFLIIDSDRYLRATFTAALRTFEPDVVVYLGDLMDEGSIATKDQFQRYVARLAYIFRIDGKVPITQVVLPGDRDVGWDKNSLKYSHNIRQFDRVFGQPPVIQHRALSFYKVNGFTEYYHKIKDDKNFKIVVSHNPILSMAEFGPQVQKQLKPAVYFCGHEHISQWEVRDQNFKLIRRTKVNYEEYINVKFSKDFLYEIYVPTCSYQWTASKIGYGAAVIENNTQSMRYTVLWSPGRFPCLCLYFAVFLQVFFYGAFTLCKYVLQRFLSET